MTTVLSHTFSYYDNVKSHIAYHTYTRPTYHALFVFDQVGIFAVIFIFGVFITVPFLVRLELTGTLKNRKNNTKGLRRQKMGFKSMLKTGS